MIGLKQYVSIAIFAEWFDHFDHGFDDFGQIGRCFLDIAHAGKIQQARSDSFAAKRFVLNTGAGTFAFLQSPVDRGSVSLQSRTPIENVLQSRFPTIPQTRRSWPAGC